MNPHLAMGIFALYVVGVSLARLLASRELPRLAAMKRVWGRRRGMLFHFLSNVVLPLVLGIVFMSRGIVGLGSERNVVENDLSSWRLAIVALAIPADDPSAGSPDGRSSAPPGDAASGLLHLIDYHSLPLLPP